MDSPPAMAPPAGQTANFIDPPTAMNWVIACFSICLPVTTLAFGLRTWTRIVIKRSWILEDWMCTSAWVTLMIFSSFVISFMHHYGGIHEWDLNAYDVTQALFWSNASQIEYAFCMLSTKIAILMLYRRVFVTRRWSSLDWIIKLMLAANICFYSATTLAKIFSCTPRAKIWDASIPGTCISTTQVLIANGIFNVITDTLMFLIPIIPVWRLQISTKKKIGVIVIFSLGLAAPIFSIVGLAMRLEYSGNPDKTWNQVIVHLWAAAEISTGLICLCAPEIAPITRQRRTLPQSHRSQLYYGTSKPRESRMRDPSISLDELELFPDRQDVENVHLKHDRGQHQVPVVVTGIRGGKGMSSSEDVRVDKRAPFPENDISVVTTVTLERSSI